MKLVIVVLCVFVSSVLSKPPSVGWQQPPKGGLYPAPNPNNGVTVISSYSENNGVDGYKFSYELSDGQIRREEGTYKDGVDKHGNHVKILVVKGFYSYKAPNGETYSVTYESDENGYRPKVEQGSGGNHQTIKNKWQ